MQCFETVDGRTNLFRGLMMLCSFIASPFIALTQTCPPNIDFETGTFDGWTCYSGSTSAGGGTNQINLSQTGPIPQKHTMMSRNDGSTDPYGGFPTSCPNGSGYSIRLGNNMGGGEAEGISYQFTIPAGQNVYSLIYHYAVVFQDPNHEHYQQPRMQVEIKNITDNVTIDCSSFSFIPHGSPLPGFFQSSVAGDDGTPVWCKNWSAVSVNLNGLAGKTIQLFFKTADCTFRRHFGYAYIDVNSECSDEFTGARFCPDDTSVTVTAPYGYQSYTWFNNSFTQQLGTEQDLVFTPPPAAGSTVAVVIEPYSGYGCKDTLYANLLDNLEVTANAGSDDVSCNASPIDLGVIPKPGLVYSWSPAIGLSNPNISTPVATPSVNTQYILSVRNSGGGCLTRDTVMIKASIVDTTLQLLGKASFCSDSNDSAVLKVSAYQNIQWYRDNRPVGNGSFTYRANSSGSYYALLTNSDGCKANTSRKAILIEDPKDPIRYPMQYAVRNQSIELEARKIGTEVLWIPALQLNNAASFAPVFRGNT